MSCQSTSENARTIPNNFDSFEKSENTELPVFKLEVRSCLHKQRRPLRLWYPPRRIRRYPLVYNFDKWRPRNKWICLLACINRGLRKMNERSVVPLSVTRGNRCLPSVNLERWVSSSRVVESVKYGWTPISRDEKKNWSYRKFDLYVNDCNSWNGIVQRCSNYFCWSLTCFWKSQCPSWSICILLWRLDRSALPRYSVHQRGWKIFEGTK